MQHLKWTKTGRKFNHGDVGQPNKITYELRIGQKNYDMGDGTFQPYHYDSGANSLRYADSECIFENGFQSVKRLGNFFISQSRIYIQREISPDVWTDVPHGIPTRNIAHNFPEEGRCTAYLDFPDIQGYDSGARFQVGIEAGMFDNAVFGYRMRSPVSGRFRLEWVLEIPDDVPLSWINQTGKLGVRRIGARIGNFQITWSQNEDQHRSATIEDNPSGGKIVRVFLGPYDLSEMEWLTIYPDTIGPYQPSADADDVGFYNDGSWNREVSYSGTNSWGRYSGNQQPAIIRWQITDGPIPSGATIGTGSGETKIELYTSETSQLNCLNSWIYACDYADCPQTVDAADRPEWCDSGDTQTYPGTQEGTGAINWNHGQFSQYTWYSKDIPSLIQYLVDTYSGIADNAWVGIVIDGDDAESSYNSFISAVDAGAMKLTITYTGEPTGVHKIYAGTGTIYNSTFNPSWLHQPDIVGDFDVWTKLQFDPSENYQQAGILIKVDNNNHIKVQRIYNGGQYIGNVHTASQSSDETEIAQSATTVYFRIKRVGSTFSSYYATSLPVSNEDWTQITNPTGSLSSSANVDIGIFAVTQGGAQINAYFDWLKEWEGEALTVQIKNEILSIIEGKVRLGWAVKIKNEVISIIEGLVRKAWSIKIKDETVSIIENLVRKGTMAPQIINEIISIIEGTVVSRFLIRIINEIISIIEGTVRKAWSVKIVNETISIIEGLVRKLWSVKIKNETVSIIEGSVRKGNSIKIVNEVISIIENKLAVIFATLIKVIDETISIGESTVKASWAVKIINETISIIEGLVRKANSIKIVNETVSIIEGLVRKLSSIKIVSEIISIIENIVRSNKIYQIVNEVISIVEGTLYLPVGMVVKVVDETMSIIESILKKTWALVIVNEVISIIENIVRKASSVKIINEAVSIIENIVRKASSVKIINELISIIESTIYLPIGIVVKVVDEVISIVETTLRKTWILIIINEAVSIIENVVRLGWMVKIINETISVIENLIRKASSIKIVNETISIIEGTVYSITSFVVKIIDEVVSIIEGKIQKSFVIQLINETISIIESIVKKAASIKIINETISLKENIYRKLISVKIINEAISILESVGFLRGIKIVVNETISIIENGFYAVVGLVWFKGKKTSVTGRKKRSYKKKTDRVTKSETPERTTKDWEGEE